MPQRPSPSQWLTQQSPKDFLAQQNGAAPAGAAPTTPQPGQYGPFLPPPNAADVLRNSNAAVDAFNRQNPQPSARIPLGPLERPAQAVARGYVTGAVTAGGIPVSEHPVRDFASGLWGNITAPPSTDLERTISTFAPQVAPALIAGKRFAVGMGQGIYENAVGGTGEAVTHARNYLNSGDPQELEQATHGATRAGLTIAALLDMARGPAGAAREVVSKDARAVTRNAVGMGAKALERGETGVAEEAAARTEANAKAASEHTAESQARLREARANAATTATQEAEKQTASDVNWEQSHRQKVNEYMHDVGENEQAHADLTKQIQEANTKGHSDVVRRQQLETEVGGEHSANINATRQAAAADLADAKARYPDLTNGGEKEMPAADAAQTLDLVNEAVGNRLQGSGNIPGSIRNIISDYTPVEGGGVMVDDELHGPGDPIFEDMKAKGQLTPEEAGAGEPKEKATADMLHGQMTEVMKEYMGATGDEKATLGAVGDVLRTQLRNLYKAEGRLPEFDAAQKNYAEVMKRYYERSSPLSRLLNDRTAQAAFDPTGAGTGSMARPEAAERVLKGAGNPAVIERYLRGRHPELADSFKATAAKMAERDSLPKKFTPKQIPVKKVIPVPDLPLREQLPTSTVTNIPRGGLTPPPEPKPMPEPFDRKQAVKDKIQQTAENWMKASPWEVAGMSSLVGAATGLVTRSIPAALESAIAYPLIRYRVGRMMENPRFQEWAAREGITPPPQPGATGARGNPTPFAPPPTGGPQNGPGGPQTGPIGPPPAPEGVGVHENMGRRVRATERRTTEGQGPGGVERRSGHEETMQQMLNIQDVERNNAQGILNRIGVKIDPSRLTGDLKAEILNAFHDFHEKFDRMPNDKEIRGIQTAIDMRHREGYETGTKIRTALGLKDIEGSNGQ